LSSVQIGDFGWKQREYRKSARNLNVFLFLLLLLLLLDMGIGGLLPLLQPIHEKVNIQRYRGKRVAVDVASWLYAGERREKKGRREKGG
jgi:hypothetical protein